MTIFQAYQTTLNLGEVDDFSIREWLRFMHGYASMTELVLKWQEPLKDHNRFEQGIARLKTGYPIAYLIQHTMFMGRTFFVDDRVLIPRPETEELIALTLRLMKEYAVAPTSFVDLGTGSGAIALTMKQFFPSAYVMGVDQSLAALEVAKMNGKLLNTDVTWIQSDWFKSIPTSTKVDVVLSNPPYIGDQTTIDNSVWQFEPQEALIAIPPTRHYETIIQQSQNHMNRPGLLVFEMAPELQPSLMDILKALSITKYGFEKDVNQKIRMLWILVK
jgi:release factor glutamine methyltransferase